MRKLEPSEHQIQSAYFDWVRLTYPGTKLIYAVPNSSKLTDAGRVYKWQEGLTAGIPDVNIDVPTWMVSSFVCAEELATHYAGMRIEVKTKNGKVSDEQRETHGQLTKAGYWVVVCRSTESMIEETKRYLGNWKP